MRTYLQIGGKFKDHRLEEAKEAAKQQSRAGILLHQDIVKPYWEGKKVAYLRVTLPSNFEKMAKEKIEEIYKNNKLSYIYAYVNEGNLLPGEIFFGIIVSGSEKNIYKAGKAWHKFLDGKVRRENIFEE
jgi:molybdopterin synthase catalytic subunit